MLPKRNRLQSNEFEVVFENGERYDGDYMHARVLESDQFSTPLFSVVVPQSVEGSAVDRNRIRRRVYHAISDLLSDIKDEYGTIFLIKENGTESSVVDFKQDIKDILNRSGVPISNFG